MDSVHVMVEVLETPFLHIDTIPLRCENGADVFLLDYIQVQNANDITFSGVGVQGAVFKPDVAQDGMHPIVVTALNTNTGCVETGLLSAGVIETPNIDSPDSIAMCISDEPIPYPNFYPSNGSYFTSTSPTMNGFIDPLEWGEGLNYIGYEYEFFENCTVRDSIPVVINQSSCLCKVYIPNAFTPNGDLKNDFWRPEFYCEIENYQLQIYNRWGERIFETSNPSQGWTGFDEKGNEHMAGAYIAKIAYLSRPLQKGTEFFPQKETITQTIHLIK